MMDDTLLFMALVFYSAFLASIFWWPLCVYCLSGMGFVEALREVGSDMTVIFGVAWKRFPYVVVGACVMTGAMVYYSYILAIGISLMLVSMGIPLLVHRYSR